MKNLAKVLVLIGLCVTAKLALAADPGPDSATCVVNVTVAQIIEWEGAAYADIDLANITAQGTPQSGSSVYTLWTNCNVSLTADNTATAELDNTGDVPPGTDTLVTEYYVDYDGDGVTATGGTDTAYATYNNFISGGSAITHVDNDGGVEITLYARASNDSDNVADAGDYTCTQTLTASWTSD
jgi:hypothetical protein